MSNILEHYLEYHEKMSQKEKKDFLNDISFSDFLEAWQELDADETLTIFVDLPMNLKTDLISELSEHDQEFIISGLSVQNKQTLFQMMEPDDLVDILQGTSKEIRDAVWENLSDAGKKEMLFLLRYDEDDAAGLMTPRFLAVQTGITVSQAIQFIRANCNSVEYLFSIYVIDKLERLIGIITMKELLAAKDTIIISELIQDRVVVSVFDDTDQEDVASIMEENDMAAIPVTNHDHILIGIVTFDDVIDVIREEQTEDVYKMGAMGGSSESYMDSSIWALVRKRVPWLIVLLLMGTISANILNRYASLMAGAVFLIIFMPIITQTGGNTGSQSSTLMIRGLATGEIQFREIFKILGREFLIGILLGLITGAVIILRSILLPPGVGVYEGVVIGFSLMLVVMLSNLLGIIAPLLIHRAGFDPTVMSAPLMATIIDICGYAIYFETARHLLRL
ncbi:MAG: magnesium transporter [Spirochaetales bacterium]|nr:magnesium transporter [Spirochaetales bacterium]